MDAEGKFRPTEAEVDALGPEFRKAWDKDWKNVPDRPLMIIALYLAYYGDHSTLPDGAEYVSMANWTAYPLSRGHMHITGPKMNDPIDFVRTSFKTYTEAVAMTNHLSLRTPAGYKTPATSM